MTLDLPQPLKKPLAISLGLHVGVVLFGLIAGLIHLPERNVKITYVKLSYGDGGTNTKANAKKLESLPSSTVRDQREALQRLAKLKQLPKDKTDKPPPLGAKFGKETAQPKPINKKIVKIGGGQEAIARQQEAIKNDPLARINERLKAREEALKQVEIGAAQAKEGETGQSAWGGAEGTEIDPALVAYYNTLKRKITSEWLLSKDKFAGSLVAKIEVQIDADGEIVQVSFAEASGDGSFDDSALRAVKRVSPFPIPPQAIRDEVLSEGFIFTFNPSGVSGSATE